MTLVLAAHGTRDPAGALVVEDIAAAVRQRLAVDVEVAYVDVRSPSLTEVLRPVDSAVVVPLFLAAGYHVRVDVPSQVLASGCSSVVVTPALGPDRLMLDAVHARLVGAGWKHGNAVVLAAAGSSDARAVADVHRAARRLSLLTCSDVRVGFITSARPSVPEAVAACSGGPVAIASWLLAPGLFHQRLADMGADLVSEPIGGHPRVVDLIVQRARAAGIVDLSTMLVGQ